MLLGFAVRGYKAFEDASAPLAPLTLIYGQNSAGKSTLLDAIHLAIAGSKMAAASDDTDVPDEWKTFVDNKSTYHFKNRPTGFLFELQCTCERLLIRVEQGRHGAVNIQVPASPEAMQQVADSLMNGEVGLENADPSPAEVILNWPVRVLTAEMTEEMRRDKEGSAEEKSAYDDALRAGTVPKPPFAHVLEYVPEMLSVEWSRSSSRTNCPAILSTNLPVLMPSGIKKTHLPFLVYGGSWLQFLLALYFSWMLKTRSHDVLMHWDHFADHWGGGPDGGAHLREFFGQPHRDEFHPGVGHLLGVAQTCLAQVKESEPGEKSDHTSCEFAFQAGAQSDAFSARLFALPLDETDDWEAGWDRRDSSLRSCLADDLEARVRTALTSTSPTSVKIGPVRRRPQWTEEVPSSLVQNLRKTRENDVGTDGHLFPAVVFANQRTGALDRVNGWLTKLGIPYEYRQARPTSIRSERARGKVETSAYVFRPRLLDRQRITDSGNPVEVTFEDAGYGLNQLLPIIVQLCVPMPDDALVSIQQPELHVHPRLQTEMADLFLEATMTDMTDAAFPPKQVLVETHSEHILLRIQRRIREGKVSPDHVCVLYVHTNDDGASVVSRIRLGDNGEFLDEWPEGFFGERLMEILGL